MIPTTTPTLPIDPDRAWVSLGELLARADSVRGILCFGEKGRREGGRYQCRYKARAEAGSVHIQEAVSGKEEGGFGGKRMMTHAVAKYPPAVSV
jgi:hypothetical protein